MAREPKEIVAFRKFLKEFQGKIKEMTPQLAEKRKKEVVAWLDKTWDFEDVMAAEIEKARLAGAKGSRAADFMKEGKFASALADWKKAVETHHKNLEDITAYSESAKKLHDEAEKQIKALKKSGVALDQKLAKSLAEMEKALPNLKKTHVKASKLQGHVVMYATRIQASMESVVKQALKRVDPKELPKTLDEKGRKKTQKIVERMKKSFNDTCGTVNAKLRASDFESAQSALEKAKDPLKTLEDLEKICADTQKKMKNDIAKMKDKDAVEKIIKLVKDTFAQSQRQFTALEKAVRSAMARA